jgi:hypothetical protein
MLGTFDDSENIQLTSLCGVLCLPLTGDNVIFTKSTANAITFQANYVETMAEMAVTTSAALPEGAVSGLYSVSPTLKVYFSMGNLQYQPSTGIWRFAENPLVRAVDAYNTKNAMSVRLVKNYVP